MSYQTHLNLSLLNYDQFVFKSFYILYIEHLDTYQKLKIQIFQFDGIKIFRTVSDNQIVIVLFSRITSTLFQIFRCRCRHLSFFYEDKFINIKIKHIHIHQNGKRCLNYTSQNAITALNSKYFKTTHCIGPVIKSTLISYLRIWVSMRSGPD